MKDWELFEDEVANLYRLLGFQVNQNIEIAGQQIDLVCKQWLPGLGEATICVDCKYTKRPGTNSVSNQAVQDFVSMFHSSKDKQRWAAGVLVSNRPFSKSANAVAAQHHDIYLKTIKELYEELLRIRAYLYRSVQRAEDSSSLADYVPLNARLLTEDLNRTGHINTLKAIFTTWMKEDNSRQLCLLGDFGSGKTTFLRWLLYTLANQYLTGRSSLIPLFIPLRDYYDSLSAEDLAERFFARECAAHIRPELFFELLRSGRFLLLLDGFDEMGASSTSESRKTNYVKLARLISDGQKAIITCRPAYFPAGAELVSLFSDYKAQVGIKSVGSAKHPRGRAMTKAIHQLDPKQSAKRLQSLFSHVKTTFLSSSFAELQLFDERQVARYLQQYNSQIMHASDGRMDSSKLLEIVRDTYDLPDLARRPILLKLIVSTIPAVPQVKNQYLVSFEGDTLKLRQITPSVLYHLYTENELRREEEERGTAGRTLNRKRKTDLICALASTMLERSVLAMEGDDFQDVVRRHVTLTGVDQEALASEIRTCSFLSRDHRDCVRFTHKSFLEYYAALDLCRTLRTAETARQTLGQRVLPPEVVFFMGDLVSTFFAARIPLYRGLLLSSAKTMNSQNCIENCLAILNNARMPATELTRITCKSIVYKKLKMSSLDIQESNVSNIRFESSTTGTLVVANSRIGSLVFQDSTVSSAELRQVIIGELTGRAAKLGVVNCVDSDVEVKSKNVSFHDLNASNTLWFSTRQYSDSLPTDWPVLGEGNFDNCVFYNVALSSDRLCRSTFSRCTFALCILRDDDEIKVAPAMFDRCRGVIVRQREGEIVIVLPELEEWSRAYITKFAAKHEKTKRWHERLIRTMLGLRNCSGKDIRERILQLEKEE